MNRSTLRAALVTATALPLVVALSSCSNDPSAPTAGKAGPVTVRATDDACTVSATSLKAGAHTFAITNAGSKVTEFYVYADGDRIMGEVENIGPGLSRNLVVELPAGSYQGACKPGMSGNGLRKTIRVTGAPAKSLSDSAELKAAAAGYDRFVQSQTGALVTKTTEFVAAVKAGNVARAKQLYPVARTYWERIEPVAETFGALDAATDGRAADGEPGQELTGWHRIEKQLWVSGNTTGMAPYADQLLTNVEKIVALSKTRPLTALQLAQGAKSLLDEVATKKITGEEDAYSHTDLWDFKANVDGSEAAIAALRPVLRKRDPALVAQIDTRSAALDKVLASHQGAEGSWAAYDTLKPLQVKALSDAVAALSEPVSQVAGIVAQSA